MKLKLILVYSKTFFSIHIFWAHCQLRSFGRRFYQELQAQVLMNYIAVRLDVKYYITKKHNYYKWLSSIIILFLLTNLQ